MKDQQTIYHFEEIIPKFDAILARGLCSGIGIRTGQMCIEAAICAVLGEPHGDRPSCVAESVRRFKIALNDKNWSSPQARAKGLRNLGIAQIGSKGIVDDKEFLTQLFIKLIQKLIPRLFREVFPNNIKCLELADLCEKNPTKQNANAAADAAAAYTANAAYAAADVADATYTAAYAAANAANAGDAAYAAYAAANATAYAAYAADAVTNKDPDFYLSFVASLALEILQDLKSPGCQWI